MAVVLAVTVHFLHTKTTTTGQNSGFFGVAIVQISPPRLYKGLFFINL
jgi:hypothetical protein